MKVGVPPIERIESSAKRSTSAVVMPALTVFISIDSVLAVILPLTRISSISRADLIVIMGRPRACADVGQLRDDRVRDGVDVAEPVDVNDVSLLLVVGDQRARSSLRTPPGVWSTTSAASSGRCTSGPPSSSQMPGTRGGSNFAWYTRPVRGFDQRPVMRSVSTRVVDVEDDRFGGRDLCARAARRRLRLAGSCAGSRRRSRSRRAPVRLPSCG